MRAGVAAEWMYGTPEPRRHTQAALLAFLLSVMIHALVLIQLPPLSLFDIQPDGPRPAVESRPFTIQEVRATPHDAERDLAAAPLTAERIQEAFRPAPPRLETDTAAPALEAFTPPEPELAGRRSALASPTPPPPPTPRTARAEHLEITREMVADADAAKPRRLAPRIERTARAPDISAPADPLLLASAAPDAALWPEVSDAGSGMSGPDAFRHPGRGPFNAGRGDLARRVSPDIFADSDSERISDPVDRYLAFDLRVHRPADEPDRLYFRLEIRRDGDELLPVLPRDLILIQDSSESMTQALLDRCKTGLRAFIQTLAPEDRFDVVGFRETQMRCFGEWTPATPANRARAQWFIEQLESMGRTDVMASLEDLLSNPVTPGRPAIAVIVTDGIPTSGVLDQSAILEQFTRANAGDISVFPFGGGLQVNRFLLDFLGFKNRGEAAFAASQQEIPGGLQRLAQGIRRPVLSDLVYRVHGMNQEDVYPRTLTNLYLDRPLLLYGRVARNAAPVVLRIDGRAGPRRHDIMQQLEWATAPAGGGEIRDAWAMQKAYHLIGEHAATGDPAALERLRALSRRTGIRTPYADALRTSPPPAR